MTRMNAAVWKAPRRARLLPLLLCALTLCLFEGAHATTFPVTISAGDVSGDGHRDE